MLKTKIRYACFLNHTGYSQAAQDYILALHNSRKYDIKINLYGKCPSKAAISEKNYKLFENMISKNDDSRILIYHCIPPMQKRVSSSKINVGFGTFETFSPPDDWISILRKNTAVISPSYFNKKIFSNCLVGKPCFHIPHCVNTELYNETVESIVNYDKFTFLFIGSWRLRKGYSQLIEAYFSEFDISDNVQLLIKTDRPEQAENYIYEYKKQLNLKTKGFSPIIFEKDILDETKMPGFLKSADCLVMPTMGEGFGLPGLQCMSLGIPIIITDFSGCQDYANNDRATMLEIEGYRQFSNLDRIPQFSNKKWAFVSVRQIREKMRFVLNNYEQVKNKAKTAIPFVHKEFNYKTTEEKFSDMLESLK